MKKINIYLGATNFNVYEYITIDKVNSGKQKVKDQKYDIYTVYCLILYAYQLLHEKRIAMLELIISIDFFLFFISFLNTIKVALYR